MKSLLILLGLLAFINAQASTYFTDEDGEENVDCINEVIEYAVGTDNDIDYLWSAICDEDTVTDDCEFWAYQFILTADTISNVWAGESTANTDDCITVAEAGTDDFDAGNCVEAVATISTQMSSPLIEEETQSFMRLVTDQQLQPMIGELVKNALNLISQSIQLLSKPYQEFLSSNKSI